MGATRGHGRGTSDYLLRSNSKGQLSPDKKGEGGGGGGTRQRGLGLVCGLTWRSAKLNLGGPKRGGGEKGKNFPKGGAGSFGGASEGARESS